MLIWRWWLLLVMMKAMMVLLVLLQTIVECIPKYIHIYNSRALGRTNEKKRVKYGRQKQKQKASTKTTNVALTWSSRNHIHILAHSAMFVTYTQEISVAIECEHRSGNHSHSPSFSIIQHIHTSWFPFNGDFR